jgi:hypothetical protein
MSRRRKGVLGKLAGVQPSCYAEPIIGGCSGPLSEEHPLSEALRRGGRVQVGVSVPDHHGGRTVVFSSPPMIMSHASAKILCKGHNGKLSPADTEALRLQSALQDIARFDQSPLVIPSVRVAINAHRFAQFLCKWVVGEFVIHDPNTPASSDLIRYAFGVPTSAPLHFYFGNTVGERPGFGRTYNVPITRIGSPIDPSAAYVAEFCGIRTVITSFAPGSVGLRELQRVLGSPEAEWINRLQAIQMPMNGGQTYSILFEWRDDPYESRVLDSSGLPTLSGRDT